ncbi:ATP-dependent zinc metalloprotease FtsH [Thermogemmatispora carboxidivorans]|uniref:ATP-dependent zinc metalloprotease FtsH n=1 Tax=Thermogemmatispora carboxidivorans TaxID=1382306 RepID=UPI000B22D149|nr:ATP-dependent zinc metalloprotease FtsH [Thermogemmatispora carboxidivorans]
MEEKGGRHARWWQRAWRRNGVRSRRSNRLKWLSWIQARRSGLLTGALVLALVLLLFGLASQLQPPTTSTAPSGVTVLSYSAFVNQVKAGKVLAVVLQDRSMYGLLASASTPAGQSPSSQALATEARAWSRSISASANYSTWAGAQTQAQTFDPARQLYTRLPAEGDPLLMPLLNEKHVFVTILPPASNPLWLQLLWHLLPIVVIGLVLTLMTFSLRNPRPLRALDERIARMSRSRARRFEKQPGTAERKTEGPARGSNGGSLAEVSGGGNNGLAGRMGQARVKTAPPVTFADVAGIDEVRAELEEIVEFLRSPERFKRLGARIPRGALLVGPPGTGKTLLAKAVAGEAGVPFFSISASEFVEMFVGVGASRVRDLFAEARKSAPCVIFIDEIDAVGRKRGARVFSNEERDQTLNQLLVELDGFSEREAVIVLAATNRVDILDRALLRPGRFDRTITVSLPDRAGRQAILAVHTRQTPLDEDVDLERLARLTTGMSGADLANLVNEAALIAARRDLEAVTQTCFEEALARVQLGILRPLVMSERERRVIAYHEGGHALVAYHLPEADRVNCVTILPRGQSLGVTQFVSEEDRYNYSRERLMARIAVGLGGRVAEELIFGPEHVTTGAENDLQVVTDLARRMVTRWGMSEQVGVIFADYAAEEASPVLSAVSAQATGAALTLDGSPLGSASASAHLLPAYAATATLARVQAAGTGLGRGFGAISTSLAALIDAEVQRILSEGRELARSILSTHCDQLHRLAATLLEREHLNRTEFEALLQEAEV